MAATFRQSRGSKMISNRLVAKARAHTNIAIVKYWGKANSKLIIPQNSSLSLTLDRFYTDTIVKFSPNLKLDHVQINHHSVPESVKIKAVMEMVRRLAKFNYGAEIQSVNHVPTDAGLASSASGLAALALAASRASGLKLSKRQLSRLARHGSGSASRSIYGGWVEWQRGSDDHSSYAFPLKSVKINDLDMIAIILKRTPKKISSREGMQRSLKTSPYYPIWQKVTARDLFRAKRAIHQGDFRALGHIAETNAMRMHALTISADPPFTYFNSDTLKAINLVQRLQRSGIECYYTIDAGPNVKVICQHRDSPKIKQLISTEFNSHNIVISGAGPGIHLI